MNTTTTPTEAAKKKVNAYLQAVRAISDTIKELGQVPAGHLYAQCMSSMSLDGFEQIIGLLVDAELVRRDPSHLLVWVGPR